MFWHVWCQRMLLVVRCSSTSDRRRNALCLYCLLTHSWQGVYWHDLASLNFEKASGAPLPCFGMCVLACFGMCVSARWYTHMFWHACSSTCLCFAFANTCDRCYTEGRAGHHKSTQNSRKQVWRLAGLHVLKCLFHTVDNLHLTTLSRHVMVGVTRSKATLVFSKSLVVSKTETGWVVFCFETNWKFKKHITSHTSQLQTQGKGIGLKFPRLQINNWTKHRKCLLIVPLFFVLLDLCICNILSVFVFCLFFIFFVRFFPKHRKQLGIKHKKYESKKTKTYKRNIFFIFALAFV